MSVGFSPMHPHKKVPLQKLKYMHNTNEINLLFCIIEATPDSHVAWLWYSKCHKEITAVVRFKP